MPQFQETNEPKSTIEESSLTSNMMLWRSWQKQEEDEEGGWIHSPHFIQTSARGKTCLTVDCTPILGCFIEQSLSANSVVSLPMKHGYPRPRFESGEMILAVPAVSRWSPNLERDSWNTSLEAMSYNNIYLFQVHVRVLFRVAKLAGLGRPYNMRQLSANEAISL